MTGQEANTNGWESLGRKKKEQKDSFLNKCRETFRESSEQPPGMRRIRKNRWTWRSTG